MIYIPFGKILGPLFFIILPFIAVAQKLSVDSLPESRIDIPLQIDLRPIYSLAEKSVDTLFTSPQYPDGWVQADCATRYKYRFRRGPLKLAAGGTRLDLSFTGYYGIVGSTRLCAGGTVLSPWTPGCSCGIDGSEKKVTVAFSADFALQPNYILTTKITRADPQGAG